MQIFDGLATIHKHWAVLWILMREHENCLSKILHILKNYYSVIHLWEAIKGALGFWMFNTLLNNAISSPLFYDSDARASESCMKRHFSAIRHMAVNFLSEKWAKELLACVTEFLMKRFSSHEKHIVFLCRALEKEREKISNMISN